MCYHSLFPVSLPLTYPNFFFVAQINSIDIERDGVYFASAGVDRLVKLWLYDEGEVVASGSGHSGSINRVRISPDKRIIVSVGAEGAVFIWRMPQ